ncbi:MAG: TerC family protein [Thermomicrobiales bacterium]
MDLDVLQKLLSIIVVDLVLSADNAVVIGMAASRLSAENRKRAIIWGGAGAIGLRIIFTAAAALLLDVPLLQAIGGVLLLVIAFRLITPESGHDDPHIKQAGSLGEAIRTIILADVVMSLDNIIAVGGTSEGHLGLMLFGLIVSISLILFGSNLVANMLDRFTWLLIIGVLVLMHAATSMFLRDDFVVKALGGWEAPEWVSLAAAPILTAIILGIVYLRKGAVIGINAGPGTESVAVDTGHDKLDAHTHDAPATHPQP